MNTQTIEVARPYAALENHQLAAEAQKLLLGSDRTALNEEMARRREALLSRPDWHKQVSTHPMPKIAAHEQHGYARSMTGLRKPSWASTPTMAIVWCRWMAWFTAVPAIFVFKEKPGFALALLCMTALLFVVGVGLKRKVVEAAYGFLILLALLLLAACGLSLYEFPHAITGRAAAGLVKALAYLAAACSWGAVAALQVVLSLRQQGWRPLHPAHDEAHADEASVEADSQSSGTKQ